MGGLLHLVQRGGAWAGWGTAQSLLTVPNVTAHPSTASVPTSYFSMWHYNSRGPLKVKQIKIWRKTIFNMADGIITPCNVARSWHRFHQVTAPYNVTCGSGIVTVNSTSGSTLQSDTWLWDDMPLNSPKPPPYWNSTSGFEFDHITSRHVFLHQSAKFYPNRTILRRKKWRYVDFQDGGFPPSWIFGVQ